MSGYSIRSKIVVLYLAVILILGVVIGVVNYLHTIEAIFVGIVGASMLFFFISRVFLKPLQRIVQSTSLIAEGNFCERIAVQSEDEIGLLANSFNEIIDRLEKEVSAGKTLERELQENRAQLEKTVLERTEELTQSNKRMLEEIEEHRKNVMAFRDREAQYKQFSEMVSVGIVFYEKDGIVDSNTTFCRLFGYFIEEVRGKKINEILQLKQDVDIPGNSYAEAVGTRKDGGAINIEIMSCLLEDSNNPLYASTVRNIDDRKLLENRLKQAEKMESIGLLAGGVAHDLNNILTSLVSYPEFMLLDLPEESNLRQPLEMVRESSLQAAEVVSDLLAISRGKACVRELWNLNRIIDEYLASPEYLRLRQQYSRIELKTDFEPDLWNMYCSPTNVRKTVMNLILNAVEEIGDEGEVVLATRNVSIGKPAQSTHTLKEGQYVVLSVSDSGVGISDEDKQHIFEPFFSKKKMGLTCGSGLGLTVVWNTAIDHGGAVHVENNSPNGTIFRMYFPASSRSLESHSTEVVKEKHQGNGERILIVDDDKRQRTVCGYLLKSLGYKVDMVASGEEAVIYFENNTADLLVLDMVLGEGLNGYQTYRELKGRFPDLKAIVVSGFSANSAVRKAQDIGAGRFVKKPYTLEQLGVAIREALGS